MDFDAQLDYALNQSANAVTIATQEASVTEALEATLGWASIAYDRLVDHDVPAVYAASLVTSTVNGVLVQRLLNPSDA